MPEYGLAAIYYGPHRSFELKEYPVPEPAPGCVLVRVSLANICGSDLHIWRGEIDVRDAGRPLPRIVGHEMTGVVHALGEGVTSDSAGAPLRVGDRVVYSCYYRCGRCRACLRRNYPACPDKLPQLNASCEEWPHFRGGFAQYYYLFPGHTIFRVPDGLDDAMVAGANCALVQVVHSLAQAGLRFGDRVVVQGAGGLGVYACAIARAMGAERVIAIDGISERLELARAFGADETIDLRELPEPEQRVARVRELTDGWGADLVVEVAGHAQVVSEGLAMVGAGGTYLDIGNISPGLTYVADPSQVVMGNKRIIGTAYWDAPYLKQALDFMLRTRDRYPWGRVVAQRFPLTQINEAFAEANRGRLTRAALAMWE